MISFVQLCFTLFLHEAITGPSRPCHRHHIPRGHHLQQVRGSAPPAPRGAHDQDPRVAGLGVGAGQGVQPQGLSAPVVELEEDAHSPAVRLLTSTWAGSKIECINPTSDNTVSHLSPGRKKRLSRKSHIRAGNILMALHVEWGRLRAPLLITARLASRTHPAQGLGQTWGCAGNKGVFAMGNLCPAGRCWSGWKFPARGMKAAD